MEGDVTYAGLAISLVLVAVALTASLRLRLRLEREMVVSVTRGFVQLLIVGVALGLIIDPDTPLVWSWLWVFGIVVFAAATVRRRAPSVPGLFWIAFVANGATAVIGFAVTFGLGIFPVEGRTLVPIAGMLVGNAMKSAIVGAERIVEALAEQRAEVEARLALGQTSIQASRPIVRSVLRTALSPQIEKAGDYSNPGWFKHPQGTVSYELDGPLPDPPRSRSAGAAAMPARNPSAKNIEVQVRKPASGHSGH